MKRRHLYILSGLIWLAAGLSLLSLGLGFVKRAVESAGGPLVSLMTTVFENPANGILVLIVAFLVVGRLKAQYILQKTVGRTKERLEKKEEPLSIKDLFTIPYVALIALMMGLGLLMNVCAVPLDIRGLVDIAVGSALIHGSFLYFKA